MTPRRSPTQTRLFHEKTLIYGDNLKILRNPWLFREETVDLVYLDPPFNSNKNYNLLFKATSGTPVASQQRVFEDTWRWDESAADAYRDVLENSPTAVRRTVEAMRSILDHSPVFAYLCMMAPRLVELHRVLKTTGSLYLHCDPGASHYLKLLLDSIFGPTNFKNEIVWRRTSSHSDATLSRYGRVHDVLLFYAKGPNHTWNPTYQPYDPEYVKQYYRYTDEKGRQFMSDNLSGPGQGKPLRFGDRGLIAPPKGRMWLYNQKGINKLLASDQIFFTRNGVPRLKKFLSDAKGVQLQDIWTDIQPVRSWHQEGLGYPTQKPEALLERIIQSSSNAGDTVLDPFCGCGTTIAAAESFGRKWIGIDIAYDAIRIIRERLAKTGLDPREDYTVWGEPESVEDAMQLAEEDKYQFQWWAVRRLGAREIDYKHGADQRVDGRMVLQAGKIDGHLPDVIFSVKAGRKSGPQHVSELRGVIERENVAFGVLVTRNKPTAAMRKEAAAAGEIRGGRKWYPRIQLLTAADIIAGKRVEYPSALDLEGVESQAMRKKKSEEFSRFE